MTTTLFRLQQFASLRRLRIAGLVAVLLVASGNVAFGQASKKSPPTSNNRTRPASSPRVAAVVPRDATPSTKTASSNRMTIERVNELTGFHPASEEEVRLLVATMEKAVAGKDLISLHSCFNDDELLARITAGVVIPEVDYSEFQRGFRANSPTKRIANLAVSKRTNYQLFHFVRNRNEYRPMLRIVSQEAGLAYNELVIQSDTGNGAKVVDMLASTTGDYLSLSMRPLALGGFIPKLNSKTLATKDIESDIVLAAKGITEFGICVSAGRPTDAVAALNDCQGPLRNYPSTLMLKCLTARSSSVEEFCACAEEFRQLYPDAPSTDLLLLEVCRVTHREADQMEIAERLMKSFDDPFLHYYRVKGLVKAGRLDEARQAMDAAKGAAPTFVDVHVADVELLLIEGDHDRTMKAIESVESTFGDDVLNLASYEGFENFSQSPIGRKFLAQRAGFEF